MEKYQSLSVWKRSHALVSLTLRATDAVRAPRSWAVLDQLKRAVVSIEVNIVEGYALATRPLFRKHLRISIGSAEEAEALLRIADEAQYLDPEAIKEALSLLNEVIALLYVMLKRT